MRFNAKQRNAQALLELGDPQQEAAGALEGGRPRACAGWRAEESPEP